MAIHLKLISGQYLTETNLNSSTNTSSSFSGNNNNASASIISGPSSNGSNGQTHGQASSVLLNQNLNHHRNSGVELLQSTSTFVEIEIIGIPCDCTKEKTKAFNKNALNPIWNEEFVFHVIFFIGIFKHSYSIV